MPHLTNCNGLSVFFGNWRAAPQWWDEFSNITPYINEYVTVNWAEQYTSCKREAPFLLQWDRRYLLTK
jgi:hypothetical protein